MNRDDIREAGPQGRPPGIVLRVEGLAMNKLPRVLGGAIMPAFGIGAFAMLCLSPRR